MAQPPLRAPKRRVRKQHRIEGASRDPIHVLVADSNQTQSQLLSSALRRQPGLRVACCRSDVSHCWQPLRSAQIDIVLLGDGPANHDALIETLRSLHANHPRSPQYVQSPDVLLPGSAC
jgi:DNA-binding NarL/FixJ family response regulator